MSFGFSVIRRVIPYITIFFNNPVTTFNSARAIILCGKGIRSFAQVPLHV